MDDTEKSYKFFVASVGGERHTIGQFIDAVFKIKDPKEARKFYEGCVAHFERNHGKTHAEGEVIARSNIGWCFGEGMKLELIKMWNETCQANHPAFGANFPVDPDFALAAGKLLGEKEKSRKRR